MPIYEFYCSDCHRLFSFLSKAINTKRRPSCPRCKRARLTRQASSFAIASGAAASEAGPDGADGGEVPAELQGLDERRMEAAMAGLAQQAEHMNEDDPRSVAEVMRQFYERTGMPLGEGMQEALQRMQAGEDPEKVEQELGSVLDEEDPFGAGHEHKRRTRLRPPSVDATLYEL